MRQKLYLPGLLPCLQQFILITCWAPLGQALVPRRFKIWTSKKKLYSKIFSLQFEIILPSSNLKFEKCKKRLLSKLQVLGVANSRGKSNVPKRLIIDYLPCPQIFVPSSPTRHLIYLASVWGSFLACLVQVLFVLLLADSKSYSSLNYRQ